MAKSADLTGKQFLVRIFFRSIAGLVIATALVYALDAAVLRYRVSANKHRYGPSVLCDPKKRRENRADVRRSAG